MNEATVENKVDQMPYDSKSVYSKTNWVNVLKERTAKEQKAVVQYSHNLPCSQKHNTIL